LKFHSEYLNCYVPFVVIIVIKLQQISEFFGFFVSKYAGGIQDFCPFSITVALQCTVMFSDAI